MICTVGEELGGKPPSHPVGICGRAGGRESDGVVAVDLSRGHVEGGRVAMYTGNYDSFERQRYEQPEYEPFWADAAVLKFAVEVEIRMRWRIR